MKENFFDILTITCSTIILLCICIKFGSCSYKNEQKKIEKNKIEQVTGNNKVIYNIIKIKNHQYIENKLSCGSVLIHYEDCVCKSKEE